MSESQTTNTNINTNTINVHIVGNKSGFNSKNAIDRFKKAVKSSADYNLVELTNQYLKSGFVVEQVDKSDNEIKFMIDKANNDFKQEKPTPQLSESEQRRQMLKAKINLMRQDRTNSVCHKAKANSAVPDDVLTEYIKLKKISQISKMPIPEPNEIFAHPEEYKPVISMLLQNNMMKQLKSTHPYVRYFKLIAEKLGVTEPLPMATQDFLSAGNNLQDNMSALDKLMQQSEPVINIKGNELCIEEDTDSEEDNNEV
jgi:hypothetical protein